MVNIKLLSTGVTGAAGSSGGFNYLLVARYDNKDRANMSGAISTVNTALSILYASI